MYNICFRILEMINIQILLNYILNCSTVEPELKSIFHLQLSEAFCYMF